MEELLQRELAKKNADVCQVVEQLLAFTCEVGELRCSMADIDRLRIELPRQKSSFEFPVVLGRSRLRTMCARLAKLREDSGEEFSPYGGEGIIRNLGSTNGDSASSKTRQWAVRYMNTTDEHWFHIIAQ